MCLTTGKQARKCKQWVIPRGRNPTENTLQIGRSRLCKLKAKMYEAKRVTLFQKAL